MSVVAMWKNKIKRVFKLIRNLWWHAVELANTTVPASSPTASSPNAEARRARKCNSVCCRMSSERTSERQRSCALQRLCSLTSRDRSVITHVITCVLAGIGLCLLFLLRFVVVVAMLDRWCKRSSDRRCDRSVDR